MSRLFIAQEWLCHGATVKHIHSLTPVRKRYCTRRVSLLNTFTHSQRYCTRNVSYTFTHSRQSKRVIALGMCHSYTYSLIHVSQNALLHKDSAIFKHIHSFTPVKKRYCIRTVPYLNIFTHSRQSKNVIAQRMCHGTIVKHIHSLTPVKKKRQRSVTKLGKHQNQMSLTNTHNRPQNCTYQA